MYTEGGDTLFVPERRRSRRTTERDPPLSGAKQLTALSGAKQLKSAPDGIRTHAGAGLSRLPLPFGLRGPAKWPVVILAGQLSETAAHWASASLRLA